MLDEHVIYKVNNSMNLGQDWRSNWYGMGTTGTVQLLIEAKWGYPKLHLLQIRLCMEINVTWSFIIQIQEVGISRSLDIFTTDSYFVFWKKLMVRLICCIAFSSCRVVSYNTLREDWTKVFFFLNFCLDV